MKTATIKLKHQKTSLLTLLNGYKKVNKLAAAERRRRLAGMTVKDSLCEYKHLCNLYSSVKKQEPAGLDDQKVYFLKKRRQLFNRIRKKRNR